MLQRAASNAYSWWWASHIRTNQSKWLDNHLQEMEDRVKCMLLLLGEEADSFSKRAEMYYKRRPEVITQVEEVYRAYRALAERYDRISGELHKANHTIATAFPDQVQYAMLEEEDDNIPKAFTPVDPRKIHKSTVDGLMKKKKGEQLRPNKEGKNSAAPINKENAQEEINRLQKAILVMQTEKEFIKSSYESGIAKYWDLEKQINDMHEEVCHFQDEFNESAVIEDDEARALMTATALKSCEDTIINLQEQQKASSSQAKVESERIKVSREKLKAIMSERGKSLSESSDQNTGKNHSAEMEDVYYVKQGNFEMQTVIDKIKEHFKSDSDISVVEITEKIDELVNKVVDLELIVSSQTAQINRLCVENKELDNSLQGLEEEKTTLVSGTSELNEKLKQAEEELSRVQALESFFHEDEGTIHSNFTDVTGTFREISEMLQSPVSECQAGSVPILADEETAVVEIEDPDKDPITHANNKESSSSDCDETKQKKRDDDASVDEYVSSVDGGVQSDNGKERSSRERGSLVRLCHISSDSFGDVDEDQEEISKKDSLSSGDGITDMMKLQQRLSNGLEDKDNVLLAEYTTLLQNYNDTKKKLTEVETKNQECLHEIRSLHELLNSSGDKEALRNGHQRNPSTCSVERNGSRRGHRRTPSFSSAHQRRQSVSSISKLIRMGSTLQEGDGISNAATDSESLNLEDLKLPPIVEMENASPLEKKFRRDIDTLLEENLEFWLKFSASLQRVQEFQTKYEKLQSAIKKLINNDKQELENGGKKDPSTKAESAATEKQLRALKTELQVWSEQNAMLKGELQCRFTSLCDMQEEITAALDMDADTAVEGARFTSYQAAKFQGEVLNMQQENNKVADELQAGLAHVKGLQTEIEKAFVKLHKSVSLSAGSKGHDDGSSELNRVPSKTKVPLQSFLFPVKNKKPSLLARVTPVLQKQQPDMKFLAKLG